jgi:rsbT co-antagonist protein RsbR
MKDGAMSSIPAIVKKHEKDILSDWMTEQLRALTLRADLLKESDLREQSREFLNLVQEGLQKASIEDINDHGWAQTKELLGQLSRSRAEAGFTSSETATFVFSLKQPLFERLRAELKGNPDGLVEEMLRASMILDALGLYTVETFQQSREQVISRQQQEMLELSTPVVELWEDVLALPLVGTLDSNRTQIVMESLLQKIVETSASIAIIDITGVPTVDTLVAQHLLKTVAATRLMGADCIISGIRPQIAQTIVHLGLDLGAVTTKATLADAFEVALKRSGARIVKSKSSHSPELEPESNT